MNTAPPQKRSAESRPTDLRRIGHLPLWLRFNGLVDLPEVAFGIGKVCRAQPPWLVGWGSEKRDSPGHQRLVGGIDILNTGGQQHARPSLDLQRIGLRTDQVCGG